MEKLENSLSEDDEVQFEDGGGGSGAGGGATEGSVDGKGSERQ